MPNHLFPIDNARFFCAEVASAMGHIHERGVVYRDLKVIDWEVDSHGSKRLPVAPYDSQ